MPKKINAQTYKKDKYHVKVVSAAYKLLKANGYIAPAEVFIEMGLLSKAQFEDWRFARVPYLEKVITCNLGKANRILRILHLYALEMKLKPSSTIYKKWGKGQKHILRFSKTGDRNLEAAYSRHYVGGGLIAKKKQAKKEKEAERQAEQPSLESYGLPSEEQIQLDSEC